MRESASVLSLSRRRGSAPLDPLSAARHNSANESRKRFMLHINSAFSRIGGRNAFAMLAKIAEFHHRVARLD
jgi:hypothetical protein